MSCEDSVVCLFLYISFDVGASSSHYGARDNKAIYNTCEGSEENSPWPKELVILPGRSEETALNFRLKDKVVPVLNQALHHEDAWESGCMDRRVLYLGTIRRRVVSFMPLPLYPRG
jgi:hypothetical protein